jgi:hypothetical protein
MAAGFSAADHVDEREDQRPRAGSCGIAQGVAVTGGRERRYHRRMGQRRVFQGCIGVAATDYTVAGDHGEDVQLEGLDVVVTRLPELAFTLDYPFELPFEGRVAAPSGITLRHVIDAIRLGFRTMYEGASHQPIPKLLNQIVEGSFGRAYHPIGDLVIERIDVLDDEGRLDIGIGS